MSTTTTARTSRYIMESLL